jgi:hypothetical protein
MMLEEELPIGSNGSDEDAADGSSDSDVTSHFNPQHPAEVY